MSVLNLGEVEYFSLQVVFRDIHQIFGVLHRLFVEFKEFLDGAQIVFRDVFLRPLSRWYSGVTPDLAHGLGGLGKILQNTDLFRAQAFVLAL